MKPEPRHDLDRFRIVCGEYASPPGMRYGAFEIPHGPIALRVLASDGEGWEHVSVSTANRTPTWDEMVRIKNLWWSEDETVIQYHPPKSEYVNYHPFCLHLWKPINKSIPLPPSILVGPKQT